MAETMEGRMKTAERLIQWLEDYPQEILSKLILKHGISKICDGFKTDRRLSV